MPTVKIHSLLSTVEEGHKLVAGDGLLVVEVTGEFFQLVAVIHKNLQCLFVLLLDQSHHLTVVSA